MLLAKMKYLNNLCKSVDQFCNTVAGGNIDTTVSAHVGHKANADIRWQWLNDFIDKTFDPIESEHCFKSWLADNDNDDTDNLVATTVIAVIGCTILFIPIRLIALFDKKGG